MRESLRLSIILVPFLALVASERTTGQAGPDRAAKMRDHYGQVLTVHAAVVRGDLSAVSKPARELVQKLRATTPEAARQPAVTMMLRAAEQAAGARDLETATGAAAWMVIACGNCHRASGTMVAATLPRAPIVGGVVGRMLEHQRAAEFMLQGLVSPSDSMWIEGANAFAGSALHEIDLPVKTDEQRKMIAVEERLQKIASEAAGITSDPGRAECYASLLSSCADCHKAHPKIWGPVR